MLLKDVRWSKLAGVKGREGSVRDALASARTSAILPLARLDLLPPGSSITIKIPYIGDTPLRKYKLDKTSNERENSQSCPTSC